MTGASPLTEYLLSYSTANDMASYPLDYANASRMARPAPGLAPVEVYISVSEVRERSRLDERRVRGIAERMQRNPALRVRDITFKSNVGRDFSSAAANLHKMSAERANDAFVLFLNRSAHGPMSTHWYRDFIRQFERHPNSGLCGNTINFSGLYGGAADGGHTHVQTYAYLSKLSALATLQGGIPGQDCRSREEAIINGEIGLSRHFLAAEKSLTSLAWPEHAFDWENSHDPELPQGNISHTVRGLPFRHIHDNDHLMVFGSAPYLCWLLGTRLSRA